MLSFFVKTSYEVWVVVCHGRVYNFGNWEVCNFVIIKIASAWQLRGFANLSRKIVWDGLWFTPIKFIDWVINILLSDYGCRYEVQNHILVRYFCYFADLLTSEQSFRSREEYKKLCWVIHFKIG